jgi:hypothetical protein
VSRLTHKPHRGQLIPPDACRPAPLSLGSRQGQTRALVRGPLIRSGHSCRNRVASFSDATVTPPWRRSQAVYLLRLRLLEKLRRNKMAAPRLGQALPAASQVLSRIPAAYLAGRGRRFDEASFGNLALQGTHRLILRHQRSAARRHAFGASLSRRGIALEEETTHKTS